MSRLTWPAERYRTPGMARRLAFMLADPLAAVAFALLVFVWLAVDTANFRQGGAVGARQTHTLEAAGSIPAPATIPCDPFALPAPAVVVATEWPAGPPPLPPPPPPAEAVTWKGGT